MSNDGGAKRDTAAARPESLSAAELGERSHSRDAKGKSTRCIKQMTFTSTVYHVGLATHDKFVFHVSVRDVKVHLEVSPHRCSTCLKR